MDLQDVVAAPVRLQQRGDSRDADWSPLPRPGTRVLVTGAAGGLGQALMQALSETGCRAVGIDRADAPGPAGGAGQDAVVLGADLTDREALDAAVDAAAEQLAGIDAVIGAAGVVDTVHRAATFPPAEFRADVDINLVAQFSLAQAVFPHLCASRAASLVFVASQAGLDGLPGQASYAAAKAGLVGLTATLATEWVGDGIRVNAVAPGLFDTPKVRAMPESARHRLLTGVPMARSGAVAEIVGPLLFLISPAAGYVTGRTLRIDGGAGLNHTGLFR